MAILSDPVRFIETSIGYRLSDVQKQIARAVPKNSRVAVKGCHASGKSFIAASMLLWWLHRYDNARVLVVAPSFRQVGQVVWTEVHLAAQRMTLPQGAKLLQTELRFSDSCYALGLTATSHSSFAGYHSDNTLVICDEAPGIDQDIYRGIDGVLAGGNSHLLLCGNPTLSSGPYYEAFTKHRAAWKLFTINALESPNMKDVTLDQLLKMSDRELDANAYPFLTTRRWIRDRHREWWNGDPNQSPLWQSRVLGEFPAQSEYALYWLSWIEQASRPRENETESCYAGVDIAGPGADETCAYVVSSSGAVLEWKAWSQPDPRGPVVEFLNGFRDRLRVVRCDSTGIGFHFVTHLRDQGFVTVGVNNGESADDPTRFQNRKAELYWRLRERMQTGEISGLTDPIVQEQLAGILYEIDGAGRTVIESKESARRRGMRSPDRAEALILAVTASAWSTQGIQLVPRVSDSRFDARLASGTDAAGFRLSKVQREDAEEDQAAKFRSSMYLRRTHRGRFHRVGF